MNELEIESKRRFWRRVLIAGILVLVIALLAMVRMYLSGMTDAKAGADSEVGQEIAMLAARSRVLFEAVAS